MPRAPPRTAPIKKTARPKGPRAGSTSDERVSAEAMVLLAASAFVGEVAVIEVVEDVLDLRCFPGTKSGQLLQALLNGGEIGAVVPQVGGVAVVFVGEDPGDLTRTPLELPASRALRLQSLTRADEGFLLGLAYSTQRGYARNHAFVGELRIGAVAVEMEVPELGFAIEIGEITLTECETVNQFRGTEAAPPQFTRGYGLVFGQSERKAISMALVDRALRWRELGEDDLGAPAQDEEFVLYHSDNIQATGFLEHIKLPHYVDFQSETELLRKLRREFEAAHAPREAAE